MEHGYLEREIDPNSDNIINFIGANVTLHPDFGSGPMWADRSVYRTRLSRLTAKSEYAYRCLWTKAIAVTCRFHTMP